MTIYPIVEHFYSLQGEGFWTGAPAYFIRLAGCDVECFWCDTKYSWTEKGAMNINSEEIAREIVKQGANRVVITGGEPTMHNLTDLCQVLHENKLQAHLETSGSNPITGKFDWICFSPKKFKSPLPQFYDLADELKIVINSKADFVWAENQSRLCSSEVFRFLQPQYSEPESLQWIIEYVKQNPQWRVSLQTHKLINIQ